MGQNTFFTLGLALFLISMEGVAHGQQLLGETDHLQIQIANNPPVFFKVTKYFPFILAFVLIPLFAIPVGAVVFWIFAVPVARQLSSSLPWGDLRISDY